MWKRLFKKKIKPDYLVVGLGNPGEKYQNTAHNIGFRIISLLREKEDLPSFKKDNTLNSLLTKGEIDGKQVVLLFPLTFMNRSGDAVSRAAKRFLENTDDLIIVHDDTDLPLGSLRFSQNRGSAGHKGVQSIINHLKTKNFTRLRIGVRTERGKAVNTVLKNLPPRIGEVEKRGVKELKEKILL